MAIGEVVRSNTRHSGERRNPVGYVVRSTQSLHFVCFARHFRLDSGVRRNDEQEAVGCAPTCAPVQPIC